MMGQEDGGEIYVMYVPLPPFTTIHWHGVANCEEVFAFIDMQHPDDEEDHTHIYLETPYGDAAAEPGDCIIKDARGMLFVVPGALVKRD